MRPKTPVLPGYNVPETKVGGETPAVATGEIVVIRYELSPKEIRELREGASLFLFVWPEGGTMQRTALEITTADEIMKGSGNEERRRQLAALGN